MAPLARGTRNTSRACHGAAPDFGPLQHCTVYMAVHDGTHFVSVSTNANPAVRKLASSNVPTSQVLGLRKRRRNVGETRKRFRKKKRSKRWGEVKSGTHMHSVGRAAFPSHLFTSFSPRPAKNPWVTSRVLLRQRAPQDGADMSAMTRGCDDWEHGSGPYTRTRHR